MAQFHHALQLFVTGQAESELNFLLACIRKAACMHFAEETPREKADALKAAHARLGETLEAAPRRPTISNSAKALVATHATSIGERPVQLRLADRFAL